MLLRLFLFFIIVTNPQKLFSQEYELLGLIDNKILKIDEQTGETSLKIEIKDLPSNTVLRDLVYHEAKNTFYTIANPTDEPYLASISASGEFQMHKKFDSESETFHNVEAIDLHNDEIYFSASLNGGREENDFYSESLLRINKENEIEFLTEIETEKPFPDIDALHIYDDKIFTFDGGPPSQNFLEFYELDHDNLALISYPNNIYTSTYIPIADFTYFKSKLLFVVDRSLFQFNTSIQKVMDINVDGLDSNENFSGLTSYIPCPLPSIDLEKEIMVCGQKSIILNLETPNSSYQWSDGSTNPYLSVNKSGVYEVVITNSCGSRKFTTEVSFQSPPQEINFLTAPITCASYTLSIQNHNKTLDYFWQGGNKDSILTVNKTGWYKLIISNICGSKTDSIFIETTDFSDIVLPNIITPNGDQKNDKFMIDDKLQQASISIYNRYGKLVYQNPSYLNEWDSGNLNSGNYFYEITLDCGNIFKGWIEVRK